VRSAATKEIAISTIVLISILATLLILNWYRGPELAPQRMTIPDGLRSEYYSCSEYETHMLYLGRNGFRRVLRQGQTPPR